MSIVEKQFSISYIPFLVDARLAYVQKYTDKLRDTFPRSTIVVVMVTAGFYFTTQKSKVSLKSPTTVTVVLKDLPRKQLYLQSLTSCIENETTGRFREVFCCSSCRTVSLLVCRTRN